MLSWFLLLPAAYGLAVLLGLPPSYPFDVVVNARPLPFDPRLQAAAGARHLVVLVHGLWRSRFALGRLERALRAHGYDVLNFGYPSTRATVEAHAGALHAALAARLGPGPAPATSFVGHSLGGLVIAEYLRRPGAVAPHRLVFVASPLRGAVLCDRRKHWWLFRLVMGTAAAMQLSPGSELCRRPLHLPAPVGTVVGNLGPRHRSIPGDSDGTVAVAEAHVPGEADAVTLPLGHTRLGFAAASIRQVLAFVRFARFAT